MIIGSRRETGRGSFPLNVLTFNMFPGIQTSKLSKIGNVNLEFGRKVVKGGEVHLYTECS